jgi:hypothetical protein
MPTTFSPSAGAPAAAHPDANAVRHRELTLDATNEPLRYAPIVVHAFRLGRRERANVCISSGAFSVDLRPNVAELRAIALMLTATADELEMANAATHAAAQPAVAG